MRTAIAPVTTLVLALALGSTAGAQTTSAATPPSSSEGRGADLFAGYSAIPSDGTTFHGWHLSFGWPLSGRFGLLFDVSGHQASAADAVDPKANMLSLMAGPRLSFGSGALRPSVHLIAGVVRSKASVRIFDVEISETSTDLGGAAGGALDVRISDRLAARALADYRFVKPPIDGETASDPRLSVGLVYRFGDR